MRTVFLIGMGGFLFLSCGYQPKERNADLSKYLDSLAQVDQAVQTALFTTSSEREFDSLNQIKKRTFELHCSRLGKLLSEYGYPGIDLVGEESSSNFWLMIQHCDDDLVLQQKVLHLLKMEVERDNASGSNYAYLFDRVRTNQGKKQRYGTQLDYAPDGQAFAQPIEDSIHVNERREALGLESLEDYLAWVTEAHRARNKEYYEAREDSLRHHNRLH